MKITKEQLSQLIREELSLLAEVSLNIPAQAWFDKDKGYESRGDMHYAQQKLEGSDAIDELHRIMRDIHATYKGLSLENKELFEEYLVKNIDITTVRWQEGRGKHSGDIHAAGE